MAAEQTSITIRDAQPEDAPSIDAVLRSTGWFEHLDEVPLTETQERISRAIAEKCPPDGENTLLMAENATGEVVGYIFVHWLPNLIFGDEGYVSELFVHPGVRGQGIGSALLDAVKRLGIARGALRLTLFNGRERESYQRGFYTKQGWVERDDVAFFMYYLDEG